MSLLHATHDGSLKQLVTAMKNAAQTCFRVKPVQPKKPHISTSTWALIQRRQAAHENHDGDTVKTLTARIKYEAKKDKKDFISRSLEESLGPNLQWAGIKALKAKKVPNFTKLKDKDGCRVEPSRRAEAIADYLQEIQWRQHPLPPPQNRGSVIEAELNYNIGPISLRELESAIQKMKNNNVPGPDLVSAELFECLDGQNKTKLLMFLNNWWSSEQIPEDSLLAQVVIIYKKAETDNIANYRPISLLNLTYKIFTAIVRNRLAEQIDPHISPTQFGFRKERSTTHALFIARRLQDMSERTGDNLVLVLLDGEKAFDKIAQCWKR